ncbi:MAG: DinB family protein [Pedobacter sp.]
MILQLLTQEFEHEVTGSRKMLQAFPEKDLGYKPSEISWSMAELAQHIATIYYRYEGACTLDNYDPSADNMELNDPNDLKATLKLFETNVEKARTALSAVTEESLNDQWNLSVGGQVMFGPLPKAVAIRSFLFNHLYHHRGEMVVYWRSTGNKVPGMYGPTYEEIQGR